MRTMHDITDAIARKHGFGARELIAHGRVGPVSLARQEAMAAMADEGFSHRNIAQFFGGRDHTTVTYGIAAHRARISGVNT